MIKTNRSELPGNAHPLTTGIRIALTAMCMSVFAAPQAFAQDQVDSPQGTTEEGVLEEVVVTGTRQLIKDSISIKRDNVMVVDGLSASDIGEIPALSIGEALESLTGVASHRENGGATEISIRGLGPFLSATTFNGREATNGSGDRSVNFSQFPSELMNKLVVYKTQDATLIEGGVAGVIALETLRPLNYGKRRFQFDLKGNYNPDQQNIDADLSGDWGWRGTLSYVDQWELANGGNIGFSVGYQHSDISQPEQEIRGSSPTGTSLYACINEPDVTNEGFFRSSSGDCEDQIGGSSNQGYNTEINPETGVAYSDGQAFGFAPSSRGYRQNDTEDERDAFFTALQWQPNEDWDINLDYEQSKRTQTEKRHDLNIANQKRATAGVTGPALVTTDQGAIRNWLGTTAIEANSENYYREEKYKGGGLNMAYQVNDRLALSGDFSYSKTERIEKQVSVRIQSDDQDIYGNNTPGGYRPLLQWDQRNGFPQFTLEDFDVTDYTLFSDEYRTRIDSDVDRTNEIKSGRLDFDFDVEWGGINSLEGGLRYSELTYLNLGGTRFDPGTIDDSSAAELEAIIQMNETCRIAFPESDFLSSEYSGGELITNIDSETGEETSGTGDTWATFDNECITNAILAFQGDEFAYPEQFRESPSTTDVTETTFAGYLMANFEAEWGGRAVNGNFGVRIVNTEVKSDAWRSAYVITEDGGFYSIAPTGDLEKDTAKYSYTEWLPSFNAVMDLTDEVLLRGAVYRAMSRADPGDLGYNRSFNINTSDDITDPDDLIAGVSGSGNPATDPLMSWNFDTAIEWYPNDDSILTFGFYYKKFQGGFVQETTLETFVVDGVEIEKPVTVTQTDGDTSTLWGMEITAAHNFSYLPGAFLSGLGAKIGYNYGNSNFEFEDSLYGDLYQTDLDGNRTQTNIGIVAPANVPGFSDNVFSGTLYGEWGGFGASLIYKYRSEYFQPYTSNGTRIRYVGDVGVWEARASYAINEHISISVEGINLFNEPKQTYYFTDDNFGERNVYGGRYFIGLRGKF
jgi:iron complex outermembrane receptor protein